MNVVLLLFISLLNLLNLTFATTLKAETQVTIPLRLMTLNLHGYHPSGELIRWYEFKDGSRSEGPSDIFFFNQEELARGHLARLDWLAKDVETFSPDVLLLQEVGAGAPWLEKDCATFYRFSSDDHFEVNSAIRLNERLAKAGAKYHLSLACRGNTGWTTNSKTFSDKKIIVWSKDSPAKVHTVFDFGSNPYPNGIIVEGQAILTKAELEVLGEYSWRLPINDSGDTFFFQAVVVGLKQERAEGEGSPWLIIANLHALHGLQHFEAALQVRKQLEGLLKHQRKGTYLGTIIGGDFNANLYRPGSEGDGEVSMVPWEIKVPGEYDFSANKASVWRFDLKQKLFKIAHSSQPSDQLNKRIETAIDGFISSQKVKNGMTESFREALWSAEKSGHCTPMLGYDGACGSSDRIDHFMLPVMLPVTSPVTSPVSNLDYGKTNKFSVKNAFMVYRHNDFHRTDTLTDHPGVVIDVETKIYSNRIVATTPDEAGH